MKDRHTPGRYVANINGPGPLGVDRETFVGAGRRGGECNSAARWLSKYLKACSRTRHYAVNLKCRIGRSVRTNYKRD